MSYREAKRTFATRHSRDRVPAMTSPSTDLARWADADRLASDWDLRCRFAARFVRPGLRIIDIGCGRMAVERLFAPSLYLPVDVVARDARTRVVDLNVQSLPAAWLDGMQLATMLGVLEYLGDPGAVMAGLAARGVPLLASYACTDLAPDASRPDLGWVNAFDVAGIESLARAAGYRPVFRYVFERTQAVWLWVPEGVDPTTVSAVGVALAAAPAPARPTLVVAGFLGRGNCGDEAIFQVIHETFAPTHDIVVAVDEHGAHRGFWDWYPYNHSRISHIGNLAVFQQQRRVTGLLVGGGGLPCGFGGGLVDAAREVGVPTAFAGVDIAQPGGMPTRPAALRDYLARFDFLGVRSAAALETIAGTGVTAYHAADWALRLETDRGGDLSATPRRVAVVVRELPLERIAWGYVAAIESLFAGLRQRGCDPFWLPFCPEDERFLGELALAGAAPLERCWWNPRRMKQVVATSDAVVSVGRLHPLVFAASTRTPVVSLAVPCGAAGAIPKLRGMSAELGIHEVETVDEALALFADGLPPVSGAERLAAAERRLDAMIARLAALFAG